MFCIQIPSLSVESASFISEGAIYLYLLFHYTTASFNMSTDFAFVRQVELLMNFVQRREALKEPGNYSWLSSKKSTAVRLSGRHEYLITQRLKQTLFRQVYSNGEFHKGWFFNSHILMDRQPNLHVGNLLAYTEEVIYECMSISLQLSRCQKVDILRQLSVLSNGMSSEEVADCCVALLIEAIEQESLRQTNVSRMSSFRQSLQRISIFSLQK